MRRGAQRVAIAVALSAAGCAGALPQGEQPAGIETPSVEPKRRQAESIDVAVRRATKRLQELERQRATTSSGTQPRAPDVQQRYEATLERPGTPEERKPEILLRLAELSYRQEEAALREAYETGRQPSMALESYYERSTAYYRQLVEKYPDSSQALPGFYNLGYLYAEKGDVPRSAWAYREVLRRDPQSPYADEIHMRLGEAAFDTDELGSAVTHYRAVVDGKNPKYVDKALYKLGWCFYNLERYAEAVEAFSGVLGRAESSAENLKDEALQMLARCFFESGGVDGLLVYLVDRPQVSAYGDRLCHLLGDHYFEASRYRDAVRSFAAGVDGYPDSARCLQLEGSIIQALLILRDHGAANERRESWVQRYDPGSSWDRVHGSGRLARERDALVEEGLRLAALYHHSEAQAGRGTLEPALRLYERYFDRFGLASADGYAMGYGYAQALTDVERLVEAAGQYRKIATHPGWTAHREDASYRLIEVLTTAHGRGLVSLEDLVAAHEAYAALNPDSALVPEILFVEGELLFGAGRFSAAREVFERVAEDYVSHELAVKALEHIARCHFQEEAFAQTEEAARRALAARPGLDATGRVRKLLAYSIFKQAEEKETRGDREGSNHDFFRLAEELPEEEAASIALYRAAANLRTLDREGEAAAVYERLARNYPGSQHAQNALVLSAQIFASLGDWSKAARGYEEVYRLAPGDPGAADALFLAAGARERAAEPLAAINLLDEFCKRFPSDPRVAKARFTEGDLLQWLGRGDEAAKRYRAAWESRVPENESVYRAKAALELGKLSLAAFRKVGLTGDLGQALARKEALLEKALSALAQAASLPFAETLTEALYLAGEAFEHMKAALLTSERPADLTEEEREEYDFLLEEKAFPLEERAIGYYRQGVTRARDAGVHTVWVDRMFQRLEAILPWAYQRAEEPAVAWEVPGLPPPRGGEAAP